MGLGKPDDTSSVVSGISEKLKRKLTYIPNSLLALAVFVIRKKSSKLKHVTCDMTRA